MNRAEWEKKWADQDGVGRGKIRLRRGEPKQWHTPNLELLPGADAPAWSNMDGWLFFPTGHIYPTFVSSRYPGWSL